MRNQIIMWGLFVVPWLTLFFMKQESIKRFMPVAILSSLGVVAGFSGWLGIIIFEHPYREPEGRKS